MKFFIINTDYPEFTNRYFTEKPEILSLDYKNLLDYRYKTLFGIANFYSFNLKKIGHEAIDIIADNPYIQKKWADENNVKYRNDYFSKIPFVRKFFKGNWKIKILHEQIKKFEPDIIYNMAMETFSAKQLKKMSVNKKTLVIGQHAAPITKNMSDLSEYDILLSSLSNYVEMFKQFTKADYFKLGFANELVLDQISNIKEKEHDVVFIGGIGGPHSEGTKLLEKIAEKFDNFKIWGYGIEKVNENSPIKKCYQGKPLFGKEMYEEIRKSKIILNRHIDISGEYANNMRLYETTGVGSFLITDRKKNLQDLFTPQKEIETYTDSEDLISKIKYYLENPIQREEIALSGQKRTLSEHTYEKRMYELLEIIKKHVN